MTYTKSNSDKLIKPQGVTSKITMPEIYDPKECETEKVSDFVSPTDLVEPQNDSGETDIHEDDNINEATDLVIEEDSPSDIQLESTEVLEDVGTIESDDDSAFY